MSYQDYHAYFRIIVVGDASVGKTCMIKSFVNGSVELSNSKPTIGLEYLSKTVQLNNNDLVKVQIWDTAGQENYRSIGAGFIKKANAAIIVYDITSRKSFNSISYWYDEIKEKAVQENIPILLVGNKLDKAQIRAVSVDEAEDLAKKYRISYWEATSTDPNVLNSIFKQVLQKIVANKSGAHLQKSMGAPLTPNKSTNQNSNSGRKSCC